MTDAQRELIVKLGGLDTFHDLVMGAVATLFQGEQTRADAAYAASDAALYPVDISTVTPQTTFRKNAVIGINGVLYRAKVNTANLPVTLSTIDQTFVIEMVNGKMAFVVADTTLNVDWEVWTDAGIEYWIEAHNRRLAELETGQAAMAADLTTAIEQVRQVSVTALQPGTTFGGYTVSQLLTAMATLMNKKIVTQ